MGERTLSLGALRWTQPLFQRGVIFLTAMTGDEAFLKGLELGAIDFFSNRPR